MTSFAEQYEQLLGTRSKGQSRWRIPRKTQEDGDPEDADRIVEEAVANERRQREASEQPSASRDADTADALSVQEMKAKAKESAKEGAESARRARKMAEESRYIAIETSQRLGDQTEQLENAQNDVESIHANLGDAEAVTYELEGGFWGDVIPFRKPFSGYERAGAVTEDRDSEMARRGVSGVDLSAMKKGKSSSKAIPKDPQLALRQKKDLEASAKNEPTEKDSSGKLKGFMSKLSNKFKSNPTVDTEGVKKGKEMRKKSNKLDQNMKVQSNSDNSEIKWKEETINSALKNSENQRDMLLEGNVELDRISSALDDMKDLAIRMNEEMKYQEQVIDGLVVNVEDASFRLRGDLKTVKRIR
eukprot:jgi/Galph1/4488/GphlegSOOS_G3141.1